MKIARPAKVPAANNHLDVLDVLCDEQGHELAFDVTRIFRTVHHQDEG